ncbi:hypothetical protein GCM10027566_22390 [Arachidicoccus ginsenosidivorans]|jgi:hypothetical protein|uniref:Uncharacterized protein n=1 Tax=Arachidicoccus ginsenosidivorans TaxID=496057 RepID=A0A5B8VJM0_9BACT|nr:hypothetical protein [Arachidicoccus ginsenosidivorans]QEC71185.1 hypothetical protein FSB73_05320 [Arachidicoccus ginsenosidivorans]
MSVKNSIRFVEYSSVFVLCAFLLMVLSLVGTDDTQIHVNFYLLGVSAILFLVYIFKDKIIYSRIKHSRYKNLFWQVLEKIHLSENILMEQPAERAVPKAQKQNQVDSFIRENGLNTKIGTRRTHDYIIWATVGVYLLGVYAANLLLSLNASDTALIAILGLMCISFGYLFGNYNFFRSGGIAMEFTPEALIVQDNSLGWDKIIDWQYNRRDSTNNSSVTIFYYNTFLEVQSLRIELFQLNIRKIDLVLLLSHFKETYGKNIY